MSIIYTALIYFSSKEFFYLSYCFMQFFSLIYIINYSDLFGIDSFFQELSLIIATIFAVVFAVSFFNGRFLPKVKSFKHLLYYSTLLIFILATVFYHYTLFQYPPYSLIYFLLFISIVFDDRQDVPTTLIYVAGWSFVCLFLYILQFKNIYLQNGYINLVLVAFTIEAVLFTISISSKYSELKEQNQSYENMILHQNKLAKTGAMIANIAHQWRQPLNNLSYLLINLNRQYKKNQLHEEYFDKKIDQANEQIQFMSKTIDDFKDFYDPVKTKEEFFIKDAISKALTILSANIKQKRVDLEQNFYSDENIKIYGIENELSQVILILVKNAIEACEDKESPKVVLDIFLKDDEVIVEISDNGKGIKEINKIFESYYTTKEDGFGIGLNLAKTIIDKSFGGSITALNIKGGAKFVLKLRQTSKGL